MLDICQFSGQLFLLPFQFLQLHVVGVAGYRIDNLQQTQGVLTRLIGQRGTQATAAGTRVRSVAS